MLVSSRKHADFTLAYFWRNMDWQIMGKKLKIISNYRQREGERICIPISITEEKVVQDYIKLHLFYGDEAWCMSL
jgi:hypothetical protein